MALSNPEISVIVPVYNAGEYLAPCIRSVLAQTFVDFELILVDDASTDASLSVCRSFTDSRIRIFEKQSNEGPALARNDGMAMACGQYLTFLDADDRLHPEFLGGLLSQSRTMACDVVIAAMQRVLPEFSRFPEYSLRATLFSPLDIVEKGLYQSLLINSNCAMLYHRNILAGFRFRKTRYEDLDSFYKLLLRANRVAYISAPLYYYTINPESYIHTFTPERAVVLDVTERIVEYMEENYPRLVPAAQDRALSAAFNVFNLIAENGVTLPDIEARCVQTIKKYRKASLLNPKVRWKNKLGILLTYFGGFKLLKCMARVCKNA